MANPNIRTVTGKSTIPAGTAQAGTFTTHADHNDRLVYSGTAAALDAILAQGRENSEQEKNNLWIHIPTSDLLLRILSWGGQVVKVDGNASGVSAEAWELVESNLCGWSVLNSGESAGVINGESLGSGASVAFSDADAPTLRRNFVDAVIINATGTSFLIQEKLG